MRILVVDDDPDQVHSLSRLIALSAEGLIVETAVGGATAIEKLKLGKTDLVLTDLQMPKPSGLDLVEWVMKNQPQVTVFAMTAYPDDAALQQLEEFGTVECFTKPLEVPAITKRLIAAMSDGLRGQLRNISLPSLLQIVDMERKTCTFVLNHPQEGVGHLYFKKGVLVDAKYRELRGDDAATEMVSWLRPQVTIISTCATKKTTVTRPVGFIIMEAMRIMDERELAESQRLASVMELEPVDKPTNPDRERLCESLSQFPPPSSNRSGVMAVVDRDGGKILYQSGNFKGLSALVQVFASVFSEEAKTAILLGEEDGLEEMVFTSTNFWAVCRPLSDPRNTLAISVFDPGEATVAMERFELNGLASALGEWSRRHISH